MITTLRDEIERAAMLMDADEYSLKARRYYRFILMLCRLLWPEDYCW